ncbi:hypothetical protein ElyMa_004932000 [Elysia marginata]|uniref:Uncharacterized protein n=1 Tax=Elysia marginata TaxID=1093978 RepID=A0AAV4J181_9GAST|nr:hypothetical protein ElyMa_004932000 [Elysia marginata]
MSLLNRAPAREIFLCQLEASSQAMALVAVDRDKNIQRPEVSTTTEGVLSDFAKKDSLSLKDRLGRKSGVEAPSSTSGGKTGRPKFMTATKQKVTQVTNLRKRLGTRKKTSQSSPVVSSTQQKTVAVKAKVGGMSSDALAKPSGGVFSRLGKKTS